jgi:hypothetical protein
MNRLSYLWVALLLLCFSACTRTEQLAEQSVAPEDDQTQDMVPAVPLAPAESPFPPTRVSTPAPRGLQQAFAVFRRHE